jgi:hypothetical protein
MDISCLFYCLIYILTPISTLTLTTPLSSSSFTGLEIKDCEVGGVEGLEGSACESLLLGFSKLEISSKKKENQGKV